MTDGTAHSQRRDDGQIFQEIDTQEKSGSMAGEEIETGKMIEAGAVKGIEERGGILSIEKQSKM